MASSDWQDLKVHQPDLGASRATVRARRPERTGFSRHPRGKPGIFLSLITLELRIQMGAGAEKTGYNC